MTTQYQARILAGNVIKSYIIRKISLIAIVVGRVLMMR
ncbi:UNVERIFIED_CONTAM: hypothetical protein GTU68_012374 [Idotea baltica]|nr:hypothetical protein [Idotea baltica]